jgi:2-oxoglutarate dehydrogenase E1 component
MDISATLNADFIDAQYRRWQADPASVSADWQYFFQGFELGLEGPAPAPAAAGRAGADHRVESLIRRYRELGHLLACMDPLEACPTGHPLLEPAAVGLEDADLERAFSTSLAEAPTPLNEILKILKETYCRSIGVEFMHLQDPHERAWLRERMEPGRNRSELDAAARRRILERLTRTALFEQFLNKKYVGVTRFSLEGGDGLIPLLDTMADRSAAAGVAEWVLGMAHRGRLNVQAHLLGRPYEEIFAEFEHCYDPEALVGAGDVKYHNGFLADLTTFDGHPLKIYLVNNPSHLEAVNPVVEGVCRARQDLAGSDAGTVLPVLIHGDAAFAGQGVVAETLNMSQLAGYGTGGTVHIVINNQIGYTTLPGDARSSRYATDVAKMIMVPIFHVHGENPEALVHAANLALDYRLAFGKDVVIDLVCYRRYGHNEGDEPYFTQPLMYARIRQRPSLHRLYAETLAAAEVLGEGELDKMETEIGAELEAAYDQVHGTSCPFPENRYYDAWDRIRPAFDPAPVKTAVAAKTLKDLARRLNTVPEDFHPHRKLAALLERRLEAVEKGAGIDWANAEALAFASLVSTGVAVRLSGQDCGRGTFSQRHAVLFDTASGEPRVPLSRLADDQAPFEVYNSLLAEFAVLGFEYGYAACRPEVLTLWEAQFGDFANNAQSIIDLFISAGQAKWQRLCGLVLLLPHGWEGLGPEHSSARLERFLQLCAEDNMQVCNLTTPAQYFHLLRRQVLAPWRKPLVLMTPKSLLRHPAAVSDLKELSGGGFAPVIPDAQAAKTAKRVLLCSGKIYYELDQRRRDLKRKDTAIVRLEQFHPFDAAALKAVLKPYSKAKQWCWVQEEPENMGAWGFLRHRLQELLGAPVDYIGRPAAASPATGFPAIYRKQQAAIREKAFADI